MQFHNFALGILRVLRSMTKLKRMVVTSLTSQSTVFQSCRDGMPTTVLKTCIIFFFMKRCGNVLHIIMSILNSKKITQCHIKKCKIFDIFMRFKIDIDVENYRIILTKIKLNSKYS